MPTNKKIEPVPNSFSPVFQDNVQAFGYGIGVGQHVNPIYCLSEKSANDLLVLLADMSPTLIHYPPNGPLFYGYYTGMENHVGVPWFSFPDGSYLNAGADLAAWFTHGYSYDYAMRNARGIIALNMRNFEAMGGM